jgi:uncharacterized delta-60 repeat protein
LNQACSVNSDCATGACQSAVCVQTFPIAVSVNGLASGDSLVLTDNAGDTITVTTNGSAQFATALAGAYAVTLTTAPTYSLCSLANATGTAAADTLVVVNCTPEYFVTGTLLGLPAGTEVELTDNGTDTLSLSADGVFSFPTPLSLTPGTYAVAVSQQPAAGACAVVPATATGTVSATGTDVQVNCATGFSIGGSLTGLPGAQTVILQNNAGDNLTLSSNAPFSFDLPASDYSVSVFQQPIGATCFVQHGSGTASAAVNTIQINCYPSGSFDSSFGVSGVLTETGTYAQLWIRVAVDPSDNSLWLSGYQGQSSGAWQWAVGRRDAAGNAIGGFGSGGNVLVTPANNHPEAWGLTLVTAGAVVAGDVFPTAGYDYGGIAELDSTGVVQTSFGAEGAALVSGVSSVDLGGSSNVLRLRQDPMGNFVIVGSEGSSSSLVVVRYTPSGILDDGFGGSANGIFTYSGSNIRARDVAFDAMNNLIVVGSNNNNALLMRLTPAGVIDATFTVQQIDLSGVGAANELTSVVVDPSSGKYIAAGHAGADLVVARFNTDGSLDTTFNSTGQYTAQPDASSCVIESMVLSPSGQILFAGDCAASAWVGRLLSTGSTDSTFGTGGLVTTTMGGTGAILYDLAIDTENRIIAVGDAVNVSGNGQDNFAIVRIIP